MIVEDVNSLDSSAFVHAFGDIAEHGAWVAQAGAGLDTLNAEEQARFTVLDAQYLKRFGFPFILAVKGATKHQILDAFSARIHGGREEEFLTALAQVMCIIRFRLEERVDG
jgi:2-oxo-4-hydroxy-4-carboxy-5-ureidoimidazoline decarboxylase